MVVYLDVLFGANALMDYITLLAAARLGGVRGSNGCACCWPRRLAAGMQCCRLCRHGLPPCQYGCSPGSASVQPPFGGRARLPGCVHCTW